jgi:Kef-type K+ transport system membrane component KefB
MTFFTLALVCAAALLGPVLNLSRRFQLPVVIGELVVGILLGVTGAGVLQPTDPTFAFLAQVGFALVMFVAGSHVPLREPSLRVGLAKGSMRAFLVGTLAVGAGLGVAYLFGNSHGLMYAALLASSSASIIMPSLSGVPLTGKAIVEMLPQIALADAACIVLLPLAVDPAKAGSAAIGALVVAAAAALAFAVLWWLQRTGRRRRIHNVSEDHELAIELRGVLALTFAVAAVAAAFSVSVMLAGFAMGLAVSAVGEPRRVAKQLFALTEGLFSPLFFVWLGASLNLRDLVSHPPAIALGLTLGVVAVGVHAAMAATRQPLVVAASTAAQLGVPVAAATLGTNLGILGPGEAAALLLGAMITLGVAAGCANQVAKIARQGAHPASTGQPA